jgi:hypothetical protein
MTQPLEVRVTRQAGSPHALGAAVLAFGLLLSPAPAAAQEWDETYRAGLAALARGDHALAITALRRAIALRPEPGRNIPTPAPTSRRATPTSGWPRASQLGQRDARPDLDKSASGEPGEPAPARLAALSDGAAQPPGAARATPTPRRRRPRRRP